MERVSVPLLDTADIGVVNVGLDAFNRSVEDAYQSARSVQGALENLRGLKKESAA